VTSGNGHQERIEECIRCGGPTVHRVNDQAVTGTAHYDWCPRCRTAMQCACDGCQALVALALLNW
jgi:hypothetical protein